MANYEGSKYEKDNLILQRLEELREEYANTKYNKATDKHLGILRAKIAKLVRELNKKSRKRGMGLNVRKSGDGTVVLVGPPNAGKSSLLNALTGIDSKIANYAFTTVSVIPGMLNWKGAKIQIFDMPGLIEGAHIGKGGGTKLGSVIRIADLIIFVVDVTNYEALFDILEEISLLGIKVNKEKPKLKVEEAEKGGIEIISNGKSIPEKEAIIQMLNEFGIYNAKAIFWENTTSDELFEFLAKNNVYVRGFVALNKIDLVKNPTEIADKIHARTGMPAVVISALEKKNLDELKDRIFQELELECIYLKPRDGPIDYEKPIIMKKGSTVLDLAKALHSDIASSLKYAIVNGKSAKFKNQVCGFNHVLEDGDVVTLVYSKI